ncbi:DUF1917-domain-containing protein [Durotheca rogersii]|uniref:DUF1917-domain-containing protein n=1 Tax=Durotheca rogersii TaxID=419775 RepID=UPI00221E748C|nr:DUF1917-domain-containing protein [Durotheca rogersii]KAI5854085.1 DUF1917-domain-containing protein [Durotheca rogersii]
MGSDESDFYGDDDTVADLKAEVKTFDVKAWWAEYGKVDTPLKLQAGKQPTVDLSRWHNPYAGVEHAWQHTETVEEFLKRLPPATTEQTPSNSWVWIYNPYIKHKKKSEADNEMIRGGEDEVPEAEGADLSRVVAGGMERLHFASDYIDMCKKSSDDLDYIARECRKAGLDAAKDILDLAKAHHVTCGKWMLFCSAFQVNEVWGIIANATANNELGIAAKAALRSTDDPRTYQLICVYTADFSDAKDVKRVAEKLKQLGLVQPRGRPLYYKPDVYTYLGIAQGNPWDIKASIYDTTSMLEKRRER